MIPKHKKYLEMSYHDDPRDYISGLLEWKWDLGKKTIEYVLNREFAHQKAIDACLWAIDHYEIEFI